MNTLDETRSRWRLPGLISQHQPHKIAQMLNGVFEYSQVKFGKPNQGDIVIINLKSPTKLGNETLTIQDYLSHFLMIESIQTTGIYTNIRFSRDFYTQTLKRITGI